MDDGRIYATRLEPGEITRIMERLNAFIDASTIETLAQPNGETLFRRYAYAPPVQIIEDACELAHNFLQNQHLIANNLELIANALESIALNLKPKV